MSPKSKSRTRRKTAPKASRAARVQPAASTEPTAAIVTAAAPAPAAVTVIEAPAPAPTVVTVTVAAPPAPAPEPTPDWALAFLALYAEDCFQTARAAGGNLAAPRPDPRLSPDWRILGTLTAVDAPFRIGRHKLFPRKVFYGWRLQKIATGEIVLAIRGTQSMAEWAIDGLISPRRPHAVAGRVHDGFADLAASLRVDDKPLASIAEDGPITVVGHSLGAALATLVSFELARAGAKVRGVFVASPRVGDAMFARAFGAVVPDHVMLRNAADLVPKVPAFFGYSDVPNVVTLSAAKAGITITGGLPGQHHVLSYAALRDRNALAAFRPLSIDRPFLDCIRLSAQRR